MITSINEFRKYINEDGAKKQLYYEFKCTDADEDGIFSADECPLGEIDTNEFANFIGHMEKFEITREQFEQKFNLPVGDNVLTENKPEDLQFYDDSNEGKYVVVFDNDIHFIYSTK